MVQSFALHPVAQADQQLDPGLLPVQAATENHAHFLQFHTAAFVVVNVFGDAVEAAGDQDDWDIVGQQAAQGRQGGWGQIASTEGLNNESAGGGLINGVE